MQRLTAVFMPVVLSAAALLSAESKKQIPVDSKIFVQSGDFGTFIVAAIQKKKVPVRIVAEESAADYVIVATSESNKAGWARTVFMGQTGSNEEASLQLIERATKEVVFAYAVHKRNSARGKQSSAEACAKHLKEIVR